MKNNIVLTGVPSIDLAYFLQALAEQIPHAVGLVTSPIILGLKPIGLRMHPLPYTGEHAFVVAHENNESNLYVNHLGLDEDALEHAVEYGLSLVEKNLMPFDVLYLGELGEVQLSSPSFVALVRKYLDLPQVTIFTLSDSYDNKFTNELRRNPTVSLVDIEVTTVEVVLKKIKELSG